MARVLRLVAISVLVAGCEEHGSRPAGDAGTVAAGERACMAACEKLAVCAMEPPEASCIAECTEDLDDCTPQQVMEVQDCSLLSCGNGDASPFVQCLESIPCIKP
jgi:hypothetical protein